MAADDGWREIDSLIEKCGDRARCSSEDIRALVYKVFEVDPGLGHKWLLVLRDLQRQSRQQRKAGGRV